VIACDIIEPPHLLAPDTRIRVGMRVQVPGSGEGVVIRLLAGTMVLVKLDDGRQLLADFLVCTAIGTVG